jgi:hypothetical protein
LILEGVDDVESCHGLPLGMLSVGDRVVDHVLKEGPEEVPGLLVDQRRDALDSSTASQATNRWLGDP